MVPNSNRWWIAAMGTLLQMCLGSVYAWRCDWTAAKRISPWLTIQAILLS